MKIFSIILVLYLGGCATIEDVRLYHDITQGDNELYALLTQKAPQMQDPNGTPITGLVEFGVHTMKKAELQREKSNSREAISYYRQAMTAFWQGMDKEACKTIVFVDDGPKKVKKTINNCSNFLLNIKDSASTLCDQLRDNSPDRDCLLIQKIIIPFALLDENTSIINAKLKESESEKKFPDLYDTYENRKNILKSVTDIATDPNMGTHPTMTKYYCSNLLSHWNQYYADVGGNIYPNIDAINEYRKKNNKTPIILKNSDQLNEEKQAEYCKPLTAICTVQFNDNKFGCPK